jgi:hypothetical protein
MARGNKRKNRIPKIQRQGSILKGVSDSESAKAEEQNLNEDFLISFKYLDRTQGQTLEQWEQDNILARAIDKLRHYCCDTLNSQCGDKFTVYGDFPPKKKTDFSIPKHVPEDAKWARIHITGKQIIAGYVNRNVFNVVFLDKEHKFYKSQKKHT